MSTTSRYYHQSPQDEADYAKLLSLLRTCHWEDPLLRTSWHPARLEYARWHSCANCAGLSLNECALFWEREGQPVALAMLDGDYGEAHFSVLPSARTEVLEKEILTTAEQRLARVLENGVHLLTVWAESTDTLRIRILQERGYRRTGEEESRWCYDLLRPLSPAGSLSGYHLRALEEGDLPARCYASGLAFHDGDTAIAEENRNDPAWYRNIQSASLYRRDLDRIAVAGDGTVAAFCTAWLDPETESGYFEPVGTIPMHRGKGLARTLLRDGLEALRQSGARRAFVGGYSQAANSLYSSVHDPVCVLQVAWTRTWGP